MRFLLTENISFKTPPAWYESLKHVPYQKSKKTNKWLSDNIIKIANQRRMAKARGNKEEVKRLNSDFQCEARKDKKRQLNEHCQHLDETNRKGHIRAMFAEVKVMRSSFSTRKGMVRMAMEMHRATNRRSSTGGGNTQESYMPAKLNTKKTTEMARWTGTPTCWKK